MYRFHEVQIADKHLIWNDRGNVYYIGPDSVFRDSKIEIAISARALVLTRTKFFNCTIHFKRPLKNFPFHGALFDGCRLRGRFSGCDFGRRFDDKYDLAADAIYGKSEFPRYYPEAGIVDTDLSAAKLDGCRFLNCDLSTLRLPRWPCFTIPNHEALRDQALLLPWPGETRIIPQCWCNDPQGTVAVTDDARAACKKHGCTEEELRAVVSQIPGVLM